MRSLIATIIFVIVTLMLSIASVPAALIDRSGRSYLWLARAWSKIFLALYGIHVHVKGTEHITSGHHYVYVANHSSYVDIPVILASVPDNIRLMLRHTLTRVPIWGWALLVSPFLIIDRSNAQRAKQTLDKAVDTMKHGASVLLFPEGTRTHDGHIQEFKRGAFKLAADSEAIVIPVAIKGTFDVLPRTGTLPKTNQEVFLTIGEPIERDLSIAGSREREMDLMRRAEASVKKSLNQD